MSKSTILTDDFWNMLKDVGIIPKSLGRVVGFSIGGEPGQPIKLFIVKLVEEEDAKELVRLLEGYTLEKKSEERV